MNRIDINSIDNNNETPLFYAVRYLEINGIQRLFLLDDLDYKHQNKQKLDIIQLAQDLFSLKYKKQIRLDQNPNELSQIILLIWYGNFPMNYIIFITLFEKYLNI